MTKNSAFTNTSPKSRKDDYGPVAGTLPWVLKERPIKKPLPSPDIPAINPIHVASFTQDSLEPNHESLLSLSIDELSSIPKPNPPLEDHSPSNSRRSSSPSTITPRTYKMTVDAATMRNTGLTTNAGSDGDDEKSPTVGRIVEIPRKSAGSDSSKAGPKKDTTQTPESGAGGGDGILWGFFRKKEGKAKDYMSGPAKGKPAEQDEGKKDILTEKVSFRGS